MHGRDRMQMRPVCPQSSSSEAPFSVTHSAETETDAITCSAASQRLDPDGHRDCTLQSAEEDSGLDLARDLISVGLRDSLGISELKFGTFFPSKSR